MIADVHWLDFERLLNGFAAFPVSGSIIEAVIAPMHPEFAPSVLYKSGDPVDCG